MSATDRVSEDIRRLAYRVERYLRLEATERLTMVTTFVVLAAVTMALATSAIFFLTGEDLDPADGKRYAELLHRGRLLGAAHLAGVLVEKASD